jgi:drug/metabolite transporter (DMT)-like permease
VLHRWRPLLAFTVLEMGLPWLMLSDAERRLSSSVAGLLIAAVPLVSLVVARVLGEERATASRLVGLAIGLTGLVALVGLDINSLDVRSLGEIGVVVVGYAIAPAIMARRLADLPSLPVITASLLLVALAYAPYAALRWPGVPGASELASLLVLGCVCTALAFVVFFALIAGIGPSRALVITYVNPAVALGCGVLFLGEPFTTGMAVGFPLILLGSVMGARRASDRSAAAAVPEAAAAGSTQSMRTSPPAVSKLAATKPRSPSRHSSVTPSSGCGVETPR